ncbi:MAG: DUF1801 domain-containing protein [Patescibacteria group bacterium]
MTNDITIYNRAQSKKEERICDALRRVIDAALPKAESKMWHGGPVWFLAGNPIVGYSLRKQGVQLLFWSGMSFAEPGLLPIGNVKKFKAAGITYTDSKQLKLADIKRWLRKAKTIQWDYKNIIKRRGKLIRLK